MNFWSAIISFLLNVTGDLSDLQAPPQFYSVKIETDSDNIEIDKNNKNNNKNISITK